MQITHAIKTIIEGNGLTQQESYDAIDQIMSGKATDAQIAGLLVALRVKGETVDEITGGARALAEKANRIHPHVPFCVDPVGTGGDGTNTFNISSTAAIVAAAAGACVAKHATAVSQAVRAVLISMSLLASISHYLLPRLRAVSKKSDSDSCSRLPSTLPCVLPVRFASSLL